MSLHHLAELAAKAANIIDTANEKLGPLGPMNPFRMSQVIYYEALLAARSINKQDPEDELTA